ncbi:MAG: beta-propeller fold lactonase family protein [Gammaproteobacteria bacterium]|nr:beta-propeller fold lactonase family protein [Gammaproteobacteria bacterium]
MKPGTLGPLMLSVFFAGSIAIANAAPLEFRLVATSAENLAKPHDIVLSPDGKHLFVADNENDRIVVLNAATLAEVGMFGNDELAAPHDVAFDGQGRLLVADTRNHRIAIYAINGADGQLAGSLQGRIRAPEGVGVHADGRVFATGAGSGNLVVFGGGKVISEIHGFSSPHDVEFDPSGRAWVADASNDRVVRLNASLEIDLVRSGRSYAFNGPRYMDFDADGRLYVADKYSNQIKIIAADGTLLQVLGTDRAGKGEGVFRHPEGVEIRGPDVWISDTYNDRVVRYRMTSP